jgi:cathepsin D
MALPPISTLQRDPFFVTAHAQGQLASNVFGMYIATKGSELYLGGTNSKHYSGSIEYHQLASRSGHWQLGGAKAIVGGTTATSGFQTIIDSGTTLIYGPPAAVSQLYSNIPGAAISDSNGFYSFPCNAVPSVSFNWGGQNWNIKKYVFTP